MSSLSKRSTHNNSPMCSTEYIDIINGKNAQNSTRKVFDKIKRYLDDNQYAMHLEDTIGQVQGDVQEEEPGNKSVVDMVKMVEEAQRENVKNAYKRKETKENVRQNETIDACKIVKQTENENKGIEACASLDSVMEQEVERIEPADVLRCIFDEKVSDTDNNNQIEKLDLDAEIIQVDCKQMMCVPTEQEKAVVSNRGVILFVESVNVNLNGEKDRETSKRIATNDFCENQPIHNEQSMECMITQTANICAEKMSLQEESVTKQREVHCINTDSEGRILTEEDFVNIRDVKEEQATMREQKTTFEPKEFVEYETLSDEQKIQLAIYCCKKIRKTETKSILKRTIGWIKNIINPKNDSYYYNKKHISDQFYNFQSLIADSAYKSSFVFRQHYDETKALDQANQMHMDKLQNIEKMTIYQLIGIYKGYVREVLNGFLPACICKTLFSLDAKGVFNASEYERYKKIIKFLPFVFPENEKKILQQIFTIFESVVDNYRDTKMDMKGIIICIAPSVFPQESIKTPKHAMGVGKIISIMQLLNYDKIDKNVYNDFIAYYRKRSNKK